MTIDLVDGEKRKKVDVKNEDGKKEKLPLYLDGESVSGKVIHNSFLFLATRLKTSY